MTLAPDVIVVGAGIIGCSIAHELARRRARVEVLEMRGVGLGATQASAGVLAPYIEGHDRGPLLDLCVRSLELYDDFIARVRDAAGMEIQYARPGTLQVATDEEALEHLTAAAARHRSTGVRSTLVDAAAARDAEPQLAEGVLGALLVPEHGLVNARELARALASAAAASDATFTEARRVLRIASDGEGVRIETTDGALAAGAAVLAAGSWSGLIEIGGAPALPVRPVRGQLLQLAWPGRRALSRIVWGARCYLVPWADGSVLVGATVEDTGFDERTTVAGVWDLLEAACDLVPRAWQAGFEAARAGLRPATPDELPVIGFSRHARRLVYATGHYRNGVLLAALTAMMVADLILEGSADPALATTAPGRFDL